MVSSNPVKILFVCLGNICRSPTAEGVFAHKVKSQDLDSRIVSDSAGTHAYHVGSPPDERAQDAALRRGIDISQLRGRKVVATDLDEFDYILAMDKENLHNLLAISNESNRHKIRLFLEFATHYTTKEVPDPYYGGAAGFENVLDLIEDASDGLIKHLLDQNQV